MIYKKIEFNGETLTCFDDGSITKRGRKTGTKLTTFGRYRPDGYMQTSIRRKGPLVHRLIAMAFLSDYSDGLEVDHINGCKTDNRPENLRMVSRSGNMRAYQRKGRSNSSKYRGVYWHKRDQHWRAQIRENKKHIRVGYFETEEEAALAWNEKAIMLGWPKECLNKIRREGSRDVKGKFIFKNHIGRFM